jgi:hypothetical protein
MVESGSKRTFHDLEYFEVVVFPYPFIHHKFEGTITKKLCENKFNVILPCFKQNLDKLRVQYIFLHTTCIINFVDFS